MVSLKWIDPKLDPIQWGIFFTPWVVSRGKDGSSTRIKKAPVITNIADWKMESD